MTLNNPLKNNTITSLDLIKYGFKVEGTKVIGYRTRYPQHKGDINKPYKVGEVYNSGLFDNNSCNQCSFGLYLSGIDWLELNYKNPPSQDDEYKFIKVESDICTILKAGDKFRVPEFKVLDKYKSIEEIRNEIRNNI